MRVDLERVDFKRVDLERLNRLSIYISAHITTDT